MSACKFTGFSKTVARLTAAPSPYKSLTQSRRCLSGLFHPEIHLQQQQQQKQAQVQRQQTRDASSFVHKNKTWPLKSNIATANYTISTGATWPLSRRAFSVNGNVPPVAHAHAHAIDNVSMAPAFYQRMKYIQEHELRINEEEYKEALPQRQGVLRDVTASTKKADGFSGVNVNVNWPSPATTPIIDRSHFHTEDLQATQMRIKDLLNRLSKSYSDASSKWILK